MAWEAVKATCGENAETYREEVRAGKRPALYTKKQFFEELEEAKKNEPINTVVFFEVCKDLRRTAFFAKIGEKLDAHLNKLDENMLYIDDPECAFVDTARFKSYNNEEE